jgi:hypothetical protein
MNGRTIHVNTTSDGLRRLSTGFNQTTYGGKCAT